MNLPPNLRALRKRPAFLLTAVAIVALGVALATTAASIVDALVFRPIPVNRVDQLYRVQSGIFGGLATAPNARDVFERADAPAFSYGHKFAVEYTQGKRGGLVTLCELQGRAFETLQWRAAEGRLLQAGDYLEGSEPVTVVSYSFWQSALGGHADILGQSLLLNGKPFRIVGVLPPEYNRVSRTIKPDAWTALVHTFEDWIYDNRNYQCQEIIARLASPDDLPRYQTQLDELETFLKQAYPDTGDLGFTAVREAFAARAASADSAKQSYIIAGLVAALLLTACFNVGNMLLSNAYRREREFAIRRSVGASSLHIAKQLLGESSAIAVVGGAIGIGLAYWLVAFADQLPFTRWVDVRLDARALLAALAAVILTAIVSGLAPTWHLARGASADALKRGAKGAHVAFAPKLLVIAQLAICGALLSATILYTQYLQKSFAFDPGYDAERLAYFEVSLQSVPTGRRGRVAQDLRARLAALPGAESTSFASTRPLRGYGSTHLKTDRFNPDQEADRCLSGYVMISGGYLKTLGVPILRGRDVRDDDAVWPFQVALVNEAFQQRFFPEGDALDQEFWPWGGTGEDRVRIIGVFRDFPVEPWTEGQPLFFLPHTPARTTMHIRAADNPRSLLSSLETVTQDPSNEFVAREIQFYSDAQKTAFRNEWSALIVLATLAVSALLLSAAGIWYTTRQFVRQSRKELSIRLAVGATPASLLRLSLFRSIRLIVLGLALGSLLSLATAGWMQGALHGASETGLAPYLLMVALLFAVAFFASYLPARAALAANPRDALNEV